MTACRWSTFPSGYSEDGGAKRGELIPEHEFADGPLRLDDEQEFPPVSSQDTWSPAPSSCSLFQSGLTASRWRRWEMQICLSLKWLRGWCRTILSPALWMQNWYTFTRNWFLWVKIRFFKFIVWNLCKKAKWFTFSKSKNRNLHSENCIKSTMSKHFSADQITVVLGFQFPYLGSWKKCII